jgi:hypothetical protein
MNPQVANADTSNQPVISCLQEVLPHRQSATWPTVRIMDEKKVDISEFKLVVIMRGELSEGAGDRSRNRGMISGQELSR